MVAAAPDGGCPTLHLRCGSDVRPSLRAAGFTGGFLEFADPFCQGPVSAGPDLRERRARFIADAYGLDLAETQDRQRRAYQGLARAAATPRVVLWFEHDSYDQLILAHVLHAFAAHGAPAVLELICIDRFPGIERFIGLGQLSPEQLACLWPSRERVRRPLLELGSSVWRALAEASPLGLHAIAAAGTPVLPLMARALFRHLQELPWTTDGLSLTQRLVLLALRDGPRTGGALFRTLTRETEPLPSLGDSMFWHVLDQLAAGTPPPFEPDAGTAREPWPRRRLMLTAAGRALLEASADWLSFNPRERWVGGVRVGPDGRHWRWSPSESRPVPA
jgi:hypothetical protein